MKPSLRSSALSGTQSNLLLFSLGSKEVFGIDVFTVREVCERVPVTQTPMASDVLQGVISLRGMLMPVIDLACAIGMPSSAQRHKMIITDIGGRTQALLVAEVDRIVRLEASELRSPGAISMREAPSLHAIAELPDGGLVSILDLGQVIGQLLGHSDPTAQPELEAA